MRLRLLARILIRITRINHLRDLELDVMIMLNCLKEMGLEGFHCISLAQDILRTLQ